MEIQINLILAFQPSGNLGSAAPAERGSDQDGRDAQQEGKEERRQSKDTHMEKVATATGSVGLRRGGFSWGWVPVQGPWRGTLLVWFELPQGPALLIHSTSPEHLLELG